MEGASVEFIVRVVAALLAGFLLGSMPFSVWLGGMGGVDVRRLGTRNPGASNVWRTVGRSAGAIVGAADAAKGAAAVWVAWYFGLPDAIAVWAGVAAVLGHDFSPLLGFRGGKGGATTLGALACFVFPELLAVFLIWIAGFIAFPSIRFLWSLISVSATPPLIALTGRSLLPYLGDLEIRSGWILAASVFLVVLLWIRVTPGLRKSRV